MPRTVGGKRPGSSRTRTRVIPLTGLPRDETLVADGLAREEPPEMLVVGFVPFDAPDVTLLDGLNEEAPDAPDETLDGLEAPQSGRLRGADAVRDFNPTLRRPRGTELLRFV